MINNGEHNILQHIKSLAPDFGSFITSQTQLNEIRQIKDM